MSKSKHTPAPWKVAKCGCINYVQSKSPLNNIEMTKHVANKGDVIRQLQDAIAKAEGK